MTAAIAITNQDRWASIPQWCIVTGLLVLIGVSSASGQVAPAVVRVANETAWVGQRVPFFIELRANGSFDGTASFDLPQLPGSLIIKIGAPVVSSEEIDDTSWFVQRHEFALFTQQTGKLQIPEFAVRFAHRTGFVGPVNERTAQVPAFAVNIQRPPGTQDIGFLITTEELKLSEAWEPRPGPAKVGDIFKRTIIQQATELSGMALAPASTKAPEGVRVYTSNAETEDRIQRGDFIGNRSETVTYLLKESGLINLPAVTYVWWNPKTESLEAKTLPSVDFEVAAAPVEKFEDDEKSAHTQLSGWLMLLVAAALLTMATISLRWRSILTLTRRFWSQLNPPDRVAARSLLKACRRQNVEAAQRSWLLWRSTQPAGLQLTEELNSAVIEMHSQLFSNRKQKNWVGDRLYTAFKNQSFAEQARSGKYLKKLLPKLNP